MRAQHFLHSGDDRRHLVDIVVAYADGLVDAPIGHARGVLQRDVGENGIGQVQGPHVESAYPGQPPAYVFHRAFYLPVRRTHPVPHRKRPVHVDHEAAEEIGEQVLGREARHQAAYAADGQQARQAVAQGLQDDQKSGDEYGNAQQLGNDVGGGAVERLPLLRPRPENVVFRPVYKPDQEPGYGGDHAHLAQWLNGGENANAVGVAAGDVGGESDADNPDQDGQGPARRFDEGEVPGGAGGGRLGLEFLQNALLQPVDEHGGEDHDEDLYDPRVGAENASAGQAAADDVDNDGDADNPD